MADQRGERGGAFVVQGVTVRFGGLTALEDVALTVEPGQVHGVIGPNGAGKTTLFNVCCGFVHPDSGALSWKGKPLTRLAPHDLAHLGISRTLQGVGLFPHMSVLENVMVGAHPRARAGFASALLALPRSDKDEKRLRTSALETLERLGAAGVAGQLPGALPYPVQKRVALARALVADPELVLLDEPAGGLGHEDMTELADVIRGLRGRTSVMIVEHHMELVMAVCDVITVLDFGKVIAYGTPEHVQSDPAVLAAYLGGDGSVPVQRAAEGVGGRAPR